MIFNGKQQKKRKKSREKHFCSSRKFLTMYRLIDEAFRERLHDFERKMGVLIFRKLMDAEDVKFLEHNAFKEFDKLFNLG